MKKTYNIQTFIITTTLFLNSGCFLGYPHSSKIEAQKTAVIKPISKQPRRRTSDLLTTQTEALSVECTNDANSPCKKQPISPRELKPKKITEQGEIHNLKSIQGEKITIIENKRGFIFPKYRDRVVILELFGKNCSHCIKEMVTMNRLKQKYRNRLKIIAVQVEDKMSRYEAKRLIQRNHIKYPIIPGEDATNLQYNIQKTYGWTGILPYILVVKDGITELNYLGEVSYHEINRDINSIIH